MTTLRSRTWAITLAALLVVSAIAVVAMPAAVSAQDGDEPNEPNEPDESGSTNETSEADETNEPDGTAELDGTDESETIPTDTGRSSEDADDPDEPTGNDDDYDADDSGDSDGNDSDGDVDDGSTLYANATAVDSLSAIENDEIDADGNADVYSFELVEGSQVEIRQGIGGGALPVALLDEDGAVLGRIADQDVYRSEEALLRANASYTGTYYLKIDGEPDARYSILDSVTEPDSNEPNDGRDEATAVDSGETEQGTIVRGDTDYYAVSLDAGETIDVFANGTGAVGLTVYGPDGSAIDTVEVPLPGDRDARAPLTSVTAEEGGTYYLTLSIRPNVGGNVNSEYAIELQRTDGTDEADNGESSDDESDEDGSDDDAEPDDEASGDDSSDGSSGGDSGGDGSDDSESNNGGTPTESTAPAPTDTADETTDEATNGGTGSEDTTPVDEADGTTTTTVSKDGGNGSIADNDDTTDADETGDSDDAAATGTASAESTADDSSGETDDASDESSDATLDTDESTGGTAPSGGAESTAVDGPGFGLLTSLLALCAVVLFAAHRG